MGDVICFQIYWANLGKLVVNLCEFDIYRVVKVG
jgi:hypothetical protein